jgi:formylglycine-generating enzyme required for sulfatase activity
MVLIPGGSFQMGNPFGDGNENEVPVHQVYVDAFYMDAYELTNVQYKAFVEATGHIPPVRGDRWYRSVPESYFAESPAYPVAAVTWLDAIQYCNWRSRQEGLEICYDEDTWGECDFSKEGYRLPTEAEWEYAARGGLEGKRYPWGDEDPFGRANYGGLDNSGEYHPEMLPFSYETSWRGPTPVGTYAPNGYGLYDMVGNVGEWCHDWYDEEYYRQSPDVNPTGPATYSGSASADRVHRGGNWWWGAFGCSGRSHADLRAHSAFRGFRCVRRAEY